MIIWRDGDATVPSAVPSVVSIGVFDGVHQGHQFVIEQTVRMARDLGLRSVVVTFDPHPLAVLSPLSAPKQIATLGQRLEWFDKLGVDLVRVIKFNDQVASETAVDFVTRVLVGDLACREVVVGEDFHFGRDRKGSVEFFAELPTEMEIRATGLAVRGERLAGVLPRSAQPSKKAIYPWPMIFWADHLPYVVS